jgi:hypothetical protein
MHVFALKARLEMAFHARVIYFILIKLKSLNIAITALIEILYDDRAQC